MSLFVVDVESDGAIPHVYSMICFGAVKVDHDLDKTFYGRTAPISDSYVEETLAISGFSREQHQNFDDPRIVMYDFYNWIESVNRSGKPIFISDNPAYDWQWINYYFHFYMGKNPFGYSARRIGDMYCGLVKDGHAQWKHLRKTNPTHHPVDDARGNAEAIIHMVDEMGLKLKLL
jgi:hypothetical protein